MQSSAINLTFTEVSNVVFALERRCLNFMVVLEAVG